MHSSLFVCHGDKPNQKQRLSPRFSDGNSQEYVSAGRDISPHCWMSRVLEQQCNVMLSHPFVILPFPGLCSLPGDTSVLLGCDTSETNHEMVMLVATLWCCVRLPTLGPFKWRPAGHNGPEATAEWPSPCLKCPNQKSRENLSTVQIVTARLCRSCATFNPE